MANEFSPELRFLLSALATWRLAHFVVAEDGPGDVVVRLRAMAGDGFLGAIMDCFYCASVWLAVPFAFFVTSDPVNWICSWLAISGAAALLEQMTGQGGSRPPTGKETDT